MWSRAVLLACLTVGVTAVTAQNPQAPAPRPRSLEQIAYDAATQIPDPAKSAAALQALLANQQFKAHGIARMAQNSLFTLLVTKLPDRTDDINAALDALLAALDGSPAPAQPATPTAPAPAAPATAPATPMARLNAVTGYAMALVDANILLSRAAAIVTPALAALKFEDYAASTRLVQERARAANANALVSTDAQLRRTFDSNRGRALEVLGRSHLAAGDLDQAEREFKDAIGADPASYGAELGLAQIDTKRGRDDSALEHYLTVAAAGRIRQTDEATMATLFRKLRGPAASLEAALDKRYRDAFPNPVTAERYTAGSNRSDRVVLAELFTGSGCPPCVASDLALDALAERYTVSDVILLAYHANIPQPDPMVVTGAEGRRVHYKVQGVPTVEVDGLAKVGGGGRESAPATYNDYVTMIDKELVMPAAAALRLRAQRISTTVKVTVDVSQLQADVKNATLHIVLAERELRFTGENGVRFHQLVVRAVAGEKAEDGSGLALVAGAARTVEHSFDLNAIPADLTKTLAAEIARRRLTEPAGSTPREYRAEGHAMTTIDPDALFVVAYVQDADKKVLQAARTTVSVTAGAPQRDR